MSKTSVVSNTLPFEVKQLLLRLGKNIRTARLRRKLRLEDLAERVGVSRYLMSDIEKGKPTASIAAYVTALWAMGLIDGFRHAGDPQQDAQGIAFENLRTKKTAPKRKRALDDDF